MLQFQLKRLDGTEMLQTSHTYSYRCKLKFSEFGVIITYADLEFSPNDMTHLIIFKRDILCFKCQIHSASFLQDAVKSVRFNPSVA